jgi:hypothetical protein
MTQKDSSHATYSSHVKDFVLLIHTGHFIGFNSCDGVEQCLIMIH